MKTLSELFDREAIWGLSILAFALLIYTAFVVTQQPVAASVDSTSKQISEASLNSTDGH